MASRRARVRRIGTGRGPPRPAAACLGLAADAQRHAAASLARRRRPASRCKKVCWEAAAEADWWHVGCSQPFPHACAPARAGLLH